MSRFVTKELLAGLEADMQAFIYTAQQLHVHGADTLNKQPGAGKWSVAQVLEHLNTYYRYYLPAMRQAMLKARGHYAPAASFRSGWLGDYFTRTMYGDVVTKKTVNNKMKAAGHHQPSALLDPAMVISEFIAGSQQLVTLMQEAQHLDMARVRIPISIAKWIKISLGDTFRFMVAHNTRHFLQLSNTLAVADGVTTQAGNTVPSSQSTLIMSS